MSTDFSIGNLWAHGGTQIEDAIFTFLSNQYSLYGDRFRKDIFLKESDSNF